MSITKYGLILIALVWCTPLYAQFEPPVNVVPPSPEAAALGKYGDIPVNFSTGIPSIDIPIYTIQTGDIQVPISLSYHAGGLRVGEVASWVGLGWTLNAGGMVSRTVRGRPDEFGYPAVMEEVLKSDSLSLLGDVTTVSSSPAKNRLEALLVFSGYDHENDMFFYNFAGRSGRMVMDTTGQFHPLSRERWDIDPHMTVVLSNNIDFSTGAQIRRFTIEDTNGFTYNFNQPEQTSATNSNTPDIELYNTAWYLTNITSKRTGRQVSFSYNQDPFIQRDPILVHSRVDEICFAAPNVPDRDGEFAFSQSGVGYTPQHLNSITWAQGRIDFYYNTDREDLANMAQLDSLVISNYRGDVIKSVVFTYDYFVGGFSSNTTTNPGISKNLRLLSVRERFPSGSSNPPHRFTYYGTPPARDSFAQDHWGFFNGVDNSDLVPSYFNHLGSLREGANREPRFPASLNGTLTEIEYPTGGYSRFEYEEHDYFSNFTTTPMQVRVYAEDEAPLIVGLPGQEQLVPCVTCQSLDTAYFTTSGDVLNDIMNLSLQIPNGFTLENLGDVTVILQNRDGGVWADEAIYDITQHTNQVREQLRSNTEYRLIAKAVAPGSRVSVEVLWDDIDTGNPGELPLGGFRIKKIEDFADYDSETPALVKEYRYVQKSDTTLTSGLTVGPRINYRSATTLRVLNEGGSCESFRITTSPTNHIGTTNGSTVLYQNVYEYIGGDFSTGWNQYEYLFFPDEPLPSHSSGFSLATSQAWRRGQLKRQRTFNESGQLVYDMQNTYTMEEYFRIPSISPLELVDDLTNIGLGRAYNFFIYEHVVGRPFMTRSVETRYDLNGENPVTQTMDYTFDTVHYQETGRRMTLSDGRMDSVITRYFEDPANNIYLAEEAISLRGGAVVNAGFQQINPSTYLPETFKARDFKDPITLSDYLSNRDNYLVETAHVTYDNFGQPLQVTQRNGITTQYQYGYNNTTPIAQLVFASAENFYYEGFEDFAGAATAQHRIGEKSHPGLFTISFVPDNPTFNYLLTYWEYDGNMWVKHEQPYTGSTTIGAPGHYIDDVRIYPEEAHMNTYNYVPILGMTFRVDPNNIDAAYDYTSRQRLKNIKDHEANILQHYRYTFWNE